MENRHFIKLLDGYQRNCPRACKELANYLTATGNKVASHFRINHSKEELEDCISSKIFYLLTGPLFKYDGRVSPEAWLWRIFKNSLNDLHDQVKRNHEKFTNLGSEYALSDSYFDADSFLMRCEQVKGLSAAFRVLEPIERQIIFLTFYEEVNCQELALKLKISVNNLTVKKSRALKKLRIYLEK